MKSFWPHFVFAILLQPALADPADSTDPPALRAPINARISSTNFKHVLCWDPAPGAAPQMLYVVLTRVRGRRWKELSSSSDTCLQIKLENEVMYKLAVKTLSNTTLSPLSNIVTFYPARQSHVGPPGLSLAGCGDCIQINISLPQADKDANIPDIQKYYGVPFTVLYRKKNDMRSMNLTTFDRSFTLSNLERAAEYCVQVVLLTHLNQQTVPSAWTCIFSSPAPGTGFSGVVAPLLSVGILLLIFIMVFLGYTGYLCKLAVAPPEALIVKESHLWTSTHCPAALPTRLTLTPERTVPDALTLQSRWRPDRPAAPPVAATTYCFELEGDEEQYEEECTNNYMERDPGLSSGRQLFPDGPPPSEVSKNLAVKQCAELESDPDEPVPGPRGKPPAPPGESPAPSTELFTPLGDPPAAPGESPAPSTELFTQLGDSPDPPGVQDEANEGNEELQSCSSTVDLFSVTIASLAVKKEYLQEEQDNCDFFSELSMKSLFPGDYRSTLIDSQSKAGLESL